MSKEEQGHPESDLSWDPIWTHVLYPVLRAPDGILTSVKDMIGGVTSIFSIG